jgi:hypothetical protein
VKNPVRQTYILKEAIGTQIRVGFLLRHYIVFTNKNSLRLEGDIWGGSLISRCAGVLLNTDVSEISVTGDISALGVSVPQCTRLSVLPVFQ